MQSSGTPGWTEVGEQSLETKRVCEVSRIQQPHTLPFPAGAPRKWVM